MEELMLLVQKSGDAAHIQAFSIPLEQGTVSAGRAVKTQATFICKQYLFKPLFKMFLFLKKKKKKQIN